MRYTILGSTQALSDGGAPVALAGGRLRALLTALALRPGRGVAADVLIDEVWDGEPPSGASGALQALVGRLRRAIGHDALGSVEGGYRLVAEREDVDLFRFERLAEEGARALADDDPVKAVQLLGDALALWRGPALADLPDRTAAAVRVEALRLDAQRSRFTAELALGRAGHILPALAELAAAHPLDEPLRALHLRALRAAGRTADALTEYDAIRRDLADRLGTDPSAELRGLYAELLTPEPVPERAPVRAAVPAGVSAAVPAAMGNGSAARRSPARGGPASRAAGQGNRRARLTSFVGREAELAALGADLARGRLVTVTGPGGTGKTRLSQEAGDLLADRWADGVWYAELAPVSDPRTLPEAVISSLGLRETLLHSAGAAEAAIAAETKPRDAVQQLADYCASRELLLVLDNCEHVIDAAAALAEQLLADCPGLSVLATSREPLGVPGELVRPLDPLPDPTALRLLADRGTAARAGFSLEEDPVACAELCRRLDGLPLAIELAAARLRSLSPRQLADRLDDRFRLLTGGSRTLLPRQQTLRAVVDWSWDLLDPAERVLLRRLAVFRGGWTLEAVEAICTDPPGTPVAAADPRGRDGIAGAEAAALLASLVDKSLVLAELSGDGPRYRMLETIGEYAVERLDESGERDAVEARHIGYFREYARTADPKLRGADQLAWLERLEREHENLRAALRRAVDAGDEQEALMLVLGCAWFWEMRDYVSERLHWPGRVAALGPDPFAEPPALLPLLRSPLDDPPPLEGERLLEARRHARLIDLAAREGDNEWWGDEALAHIGTALIETYPPHLPQSARQPGVMRAYGAFFGGHFERLHPLIDETVQACRDHGRTWELAYTLQLRAKISNDVTERLAASVEDIAEARALFERLGDEWGTAETLSAEAEAASNAGDWAHAARCCREGIDLARKIGSHQHVPVLMVRLGDALVNSGRPEEGERVLREGIEDGERFGAAGDAAIFFGRVLLASMLSRRQDVAGALAVVEQTMAEGSGGVPRFVTGMLKGMKGYLVGLAGDPVAGLDLLREGLTELRAHPLADVITPRLAILLAPGAIELLALLAESEREPEQEPVSVPESASGSAVGPADRAATAAVLLNAHDRLRPNAVPPAEARDIERVRTRVRGMLGEERYAAAYAEGDGLSLDEAVAVMCGAR